MHRFSVLLLLASIACSGGGPPGAGTGGPGRGPRPEPVTVVEVEEVGPGEVAEILQASAVVESERAASLFPSASGVVLSIHADEGDRVRQGQLLAVLENVTLDASAQRAATDLKRLEEQYRQLEELARRGAVSDQELDEVRYQLETARTSAREASHSFGQTRLTAPFDGVVARRSVRVGELATSGAAAFEIVDLDQLRVVASLPERDLPRVSIGQPARLTSAYDPDAAAVGSVRRVAPVVDAESGTFRVTIELADDQQALRPGQFVTVELEVDRRREVLVVPKRAVVYEDGSPVVYVRVPAPPPEPADEAEQPEQGAGFFGAIFGNAPDEAHAGQEPAPDAGPKWVADRIPVELGLVDELFAEVVEGLSGGEQVIVLGQSHLRDGARVRTPDEAPVEPPAEADAGAPDQGGDHG